MPVRMEKDHPDPRKQNNPSPNPQQNNKPKSKLPLVWLIVAIVAVFKRPKILVPLVIILGALYLFRSFFLGNVASDINYESVAEEFSFGAELNEEEYDKAMVYEPLSVGASSLPSSANLENYAPRILHQGRQGSCSGWASAYGARTIAFSQATGRNPDQSAFSPAFLYNQIAHQGCQGAYMRDAMEGLRVIGSLPFRDFGYTDKSCQIMPDTRERQAAEKYRIKGYNRLTTSATNYRPDIYGVKQHLAQGAPVVIGMMVGQSFQRNMMGRSLWKPSRSEYAGNGLGGHAMCVVGYDDNLSGGAFRIMNSWGESWGDKGYAWVKYDDFSHFVKEAYGLFPEGKAKDTRIEDRLEVRFALVENESNEIIPLVQKDEIVFNTKAPIRKGTKFKMAITNSVECYTYIFGMETDGSNYTLFPYTNKHSPYCGITGTRLFPKDYSMTVDNIGSKDYIAIVVSKTELNYDLINQRMNSSRQSSYLRRMIESLSEEFVPECDFDVDGSVYFNCKTGDKNVLGMIIEIDKR